MYHKYWDLFVTFIVRVGGRLRFFGKLLYSCFHLSFRAVSNARCSKWSCEVSNRIQNILCAQLLGNCWRVRSSSPFRKCVLLPSPGRSVCPRIWNISSTGFLIGYSPPSFQEFPRFCPTHFFNIAWPGSWNFVPPDRWTYCFIHAFGWKQSASDPVIQNQPCYHGLGFVRSRFQRRGRLVGRLQACDRTSQNEKYQKKIHASSSGDPRGREIRSLGAPLKRGRRTLCNR